MSATTAATTAATTVATAVPIVNWSWVSETNAKIRIADHIRYYNGHQQINQRNIAFLLKKLPRREFKANDDMMRLYIEYEYDISNLVHAP